MNLRIAFLLALTVVVFACNSDVNPSVEVAHSEQVALSEKTIAKIAVDGMMCEIACGGKIRKELSEIQGVASAAIEFTEGADVNFALVEFNPELVKEEQLITCINTISDGDLYAVKNMEVIHFSPSEEIIQGEAEEDGLEMSESYFQLPGISNLIQRIFDSVL
jgi:copper chaperone CopZ